MAFFYQHGKLEAISGGSYINTYINTNKNYSIDTF